MTQTFTKNDVPELPSGWYVKVDTNRWGQGSAVVFDQDNTWVAEGRTVDDALRVALGG